MDREPTRPSRFGGILGGVLLLSVLFVLVLGVYGAVYLDEFRPPSNQVAAIPAPPPPPVPPAQPIQPPAPSQATVPLPPPGFGDVNPAAGTGLGYAAKPGYWVEFGAYLGPLHAERLVQKLDGIGIKSVITKAQGAGGVTYYRVRSAANGAREPAAADSRRAADAIGIEPLLHSGGSATAPVVFVPRAAPNPEMRYWVQFGAYDLEGYAKLLVAKLRESGFDATLIERRRADGRPLYLVRAVSLRSRVEAEKIAADGQGFLGTPTLVGQTPATTGL